jgi:hypothetical protein
MDRSPSLLGEDSSQPRTIRLCPRYCRRWRAIIGLRPRYHPHWRAIIRWRRRYRPHRLTGQCVAVASHCGWQQDLLRLIYRKSVANLP